MDINAPDFECKKRICPLDKFELHCVITANGSIRKQQPKRAITKKGLGGPAPSDSPRRILN